MELIMDPHTWVAFLTLTLLEIVLGIDNIIFIAILAGRLPKAKQNSARISGLGLAMFMRIALLLSIAWVMGLKSTLFSIFDMEFSVRDMILITGGGFLIAKSTLEIHNNLEGEDGDEEAKGAATFAGIISQIAILDIVFSLDSVITAIGLAEHIEIMIAAIVVAVLVMMVSSAVISEFVDEHPTVKMLALSFLILIGVALIADGFDLHIPKGYIYFSLAFSLFVEALNMNMRKRRRRPVKLRRRHAP